MKFQNPKQKDYTSTLTVVGGLVAGAMASKVVIGLIHKPTADAAKDSKMLLIKRGAIVAASGYGASAVTGADTASVFAKSAFQGMAVTQALEVIKDVASKNESVKNPTTPVKKVLSRALGLSCPSDEQSTSLWGARRRRRSMGIVVDQNYSIENNVGMKPQMITNAY